ncbi:MAG: ABC transporter permease [Deltaproteobacteria bacterium]|nr:ABC transporter permease [Deltaproteobacteria bacterium]
MKTGEFRWNVLMISGSLILATLILSGLLAPLLSPHNPLHVDLVQRLKPPDKVFLLGTDHLGRCVFSRLLHGARLSLSVSLCATGLSLILGIVAGIGFGLAGPLLNMPLRGVIDIVLAFPSLLLIVVLTGIIGPSHTGLILGIALAGCGWWMRFIRDQVLHSMTREFVLAGRVVGVRGLRLVQGYLLPQILPPVFTAASLKTGWSIMAISALGYLGMGVQPPSPEWGVMLQESRLYMVRAPWLLLGPGAAITLTVLGFNLLAEGLRDAFQVKEAGIF